MALRFIDAVGVTYGGNISRKWTVVANLGYQSSGGRRNAPYYTIFSGECHKTLTHGTRFIQGVAWAWQNQNAGPMLGLWNDEATIATFYVNSDYTMSFRMGGGAGTNFATTTQAVAAPTEWHYYEFDVTLSNAAGNVAGTATLRLDGNTVLVGTGTSGIAVSSLIDGAATANQVGFSTVGTASFMDYYALDNAITDANGFSTTCTTFFGDVEIDALMPSTDVTTQWSTFAGDGTHAYSCVNETPANDDTSYIFTSNTGSSEFFNHQPISGFTGVLLGAQYTVLARKDSEGLRVFQEKVNTTPVFTIEMQGSNNYMSEFYFYYNAPLDSDLGVAWTTANYNAEKFGVTLTV